MHIHLEILMKLNELTWIVKYKYPRGITTTMNSGEANVITRMVPITSSVQFSQVRK